MRCEVYDAQGLAHPPLLVPIHPAHQGTDEASSWWARRGELIAVSLVMMAAPLLWFRTAESDARELGTLARVNCVFVASRLPFSNAGLHAREKERLARVEAHRKMGRRVEVERASTLPTAAILPPGRERPPGSAGKTAGMASLEACSTGRTKCPGF